VPVTVKLRTGYRQERPNVGDVARACEEAGAAALTITGFVVGLKCGGIKGARVDLWHADAAGGYDNQGYGFRGKVHTGADGKFQFDTIIPGRYLNGPQYRPAHIHVKVRDKSGSLLLTTQLYFDGDPYNEVDPFIKASLIMKPQGGVASYDLVVG